MIASTFHGTGVGLKNAPRFTEAAQTGLMPVAPLISLITLANCRFISVSAFCIRRMHALSAARGRNWRRSGRTLAGLSMLWFSCMMIDDYWIFCLAGWRHAPGRRMRVVQRLNAVIESRNSPKTPIRFCFLAGLGRAAVPGKSLVQLLTGGGRCHALALFSGWRWDVSISLKICERRRGTVPSFEWHDSRPADRDNDDLRRAF